MIIGDKNKFAINFRLIEFEDDEFEVYNEEMKKKWLYANYCFILNNIHIGRFNEWTSLIYINSYIDEFLSYKEKRKVDSDFFNLDSEIVFKELYDKFYNSILPDNYLLRDVFHLDEIGESSIRDIYGIIVFSNNNRQRIIIKEFETNMFYSQIFEIYYLEEIFMQLKHFIDEFLK